MALPNQAFIRNGGNMLSTSDAIVYADEKHRVESGWRENENRGESFSNGKCFVHCICPKCTDRHAVYMRWTGRGVPRKYCNNCRPLISGYDGAAVCEAAIYALGHSRKKGQRNDGE